MCYYIPVDPASYQCIVFVSMLSCQVTLVMEVAQQSPEKSALLRLYLRKEANLHAALVQCCHSLICWHLMFPYQRINILAVRVSTSRPVPSTFDEF